LNLTADKTNNNESFCTTVLNTLLENPESKLLLSANPKYPHKNYSVAPVFSNLLKNKTQIIKSSVVACNLDKLDISSGRRPNLELNFDLMLDPKFLILSTNPMPSHTIWPLELRSYMDTLSKTYKFRINYEYSDQFKYPVQEPIQLNKENAITFLSMGKESLWSLSILLRNTNLKHIVVVFVNNANYGINYREKEKFVEFSRWFRNKNLDPRVSFHQVEYEFDLLGITKLLNE